MKKSKTAKLTLSTETLRDLDLGGVAGGTLAIQTLNNCLGGSLQATSGCASMQAYSCTGICATSGCLK